MSLMNLLMKRRSIRKYTKDKIDEAIIKKILQAGMLVPSSRAIVNANIKVSHLGLKRS